MLQNSIQEQEIAMLRSELEILMTERRSLLRIAAAAAEFIEEFNPEALPQDNYDEAEYLAEAVNALSEETLKDALEFRHNDEKIYA